MSEYASGTSVLAYKSSKHHAYVLSDTSGGRYSKKSELKSLLLVLDTLSSHLNLKRMTCNGHQKVGCAPPPIPTGMLFKLRGRTRTWLDAQ